MFFLFFLFFFFLLCGGIGGVFSLSQPFDLLAEVAEEMRPLVCDLDVAGKMPYPTPTLKHTASNCLPATALTHLVSPPPGETMSSSFEEL